MNEKINWLHVVLDYGKRNPDVTFMDLFGFIISEDFSNFKISEMQLNKPLHNEYYFLRDENTRKSYFSTFRRNMNGFLQRRGTALWEKVPEHILLRLLTEGKEDLI